MNKITFVFLALIFSQYIAISQSCLPNGITFNSQVEINNFPTNFPGCSEIEGEVIIQGTGINNLDALAVLTKLHSNLSIVGNTALNDLNGLQNLDTILGGLWIEYNPLLIDLTGLSGLASVGDFIGLWNNEGLLTLSGLGNLSYIGGNFEIYHNFNLKHITGIENLTTINANFWIEACHNLINLNGLNNLNSIAGRFEIDDNAALESLYGIESLTSIGWYLSLRYNYQLTDISGLSNVTSLGGKMEIKFNDILTNLNGLENINPASIVDLIILNNPFLSECEVNSVCDYLTAPTGTVKISGNNNGCNSQQQVLDACIIGIIENQNNLSFTMYPNPAKDKLNISFENNINIEAIYIYNQIGQIIFQEKKRLANIDISSLQNGIYFVEIIGEYSKARKKLIVRK